MSIGGAPSKPPIFTPEYVEALTAAKGETFRFRGWKWIVILAVAIGLLLFVLTGPNFCTSTDALDGCRGCSFKTPHAPREAGREAGGPG